MNFLKKLGVVLVAVGFLLGTLGAGWIGYVIYELNTYRLASSHSISLNQPVSLDRIPVNSGEHGQVGIRLKLHSSRVKVEETDDDITYEPLYSYPFSYSVRDQEGNNFIQERVEATPNSNRDVEERNAGPRGGQIDAFHYFSTFPLPDSVQSLDIEGRILPDSKHDSRLIDAQLLLYDSVYDAGYEWLWGLLLIVAGGIMLFIGTILFLIPFFSMEAEPYDWESKSESDRDRSNQETWAAVCHLSTFSSWVGIPFGNVFGPLVLWLIQRDKMPFVDVHGREVLNFQISMMIYTIISLIFIPILGLLLVLMIFLLNLGLSFVGIIKARDGQVFRYPFTLRFL